MPCRKWWNYLTVIFRLQSIFTPGTGICAMNIHTSDHSHNIHNSKIPLKHFSLWRNYFRSIRDLNSYMLKFSTSITSACRNCGLRIQEPNYLRHVSDSRKQGCVSPSERYHDHDQFSCAKFGSQLCAPYEGEMNGKQSCRGEFSADPRLLPLSYNRLF